MRYSKISTRWLGLIAMLIIIMLSSVLMAQQLGSAATFSKKVSYDADDATLSAIFTALARLSGANIVLAVTTSSDTGTQGEKKISVHIKDVQIEQAVSLVARSAGLSYRVIGENTFLVGEKAKIMEESGERTYVIPLNNIDAVKISKALTNAPGRTVPIEGQNSLLVVGNPDTYDQIYSMIQAMDVPQKQIEIRVRLIEIQLTSAKKYGIDWSRLNHLTTILAEDPVNGSGAGLPYNFTDATGYLPFGDPTDFEKMPEQQYFQRINGFNDMGHFSRQMSAFDITIDWLLENNAAKLLTDTRVTAMNGEQAVIHIGEEVPYVAKNLENDFTVNTAEIGIMLDVTPMINKDGQITAKISPEVSSIIEFVSGYLPRTKVRKVTSTVTVPDGKKIIVGGLLNSTLTQKTVKLPLLGDIPILGKLFQHRYEAMENTDLIMEITPRLVTDNDPVQEPIVDERLSKRLIKYEGEEDEDNN
jgi:type II secretory pathway component GspD/PulD (secretin)